MEDHRRSGWYLIGGFPLGAGATLMVTWIVAVAIHSQVDKPPLLGWPSYLAAGLIVGGFVLILAVMNDWWPFAWRRRQQAVPDAPSQPINMDKFNELREATRPAPLNDPVTASENRINRYNQDVLKAHRLRQNAATESGMPLPRPSGEDRGDKGEESWWARKLAGGWWKWKQEKYRDVDILTPPAIANETEVVRPATGPDTGTGAIAGEDEDIPEVDQEWLSMEEETDDGFILSVVRPPDDEGRLSRCTVMEVGTEHRWSHELTSKSGFNLFGEMGFDLDEWQVEFPNDFRGGAALIPLGSKRYRYVWIANYGGRSFIAQPSWQTVARGEFRR